MHRQRDAFEQLGIRRGFRGLRRASSAAALWIFAVVVAALTTPRTADAAIYLNELRTGPAPLASVELYNSGPGTVTLQGWAIVGARGHYVINGVPTLAAGQRLVIGSLGDIFEPIGGWAGIIDDLERPVDRVRYGILGGAPAPPSAALPGGITLCRSPDASSVPPPPLNPALDGRFWTIDLTPTLGQPNDVPNPDLGRDLCINEMMSSPTHSLADSIEVCGPALFTGGVTSLNGWFVTTAFGVQFLSGSVPASGLLGIGLSANLNLGAAYRIDLFDSRGVRVYQKSTWNAPEPRATCHGDCPDHSAPPDGWDYLTCGGGVTFFPIVCSIGELNAPYGECVVPPHETEGDEDSDHGGGKPYAHDDDAGTPRDGAPPVRMEQRSWGRVKARMGKGAERGR